MDAVHFVDVSHHDWTRRGGALDWGRVAAAGLDAAMIARASYGDPQTFSPPTLHFGDYMRGARAAGIEVRGGYHNLIRGDQASINRQVDYLRRELDKYGTEFAMVDIEAYDELKQKNLTPRWSDVLRWNDRWHQVEQRVSAYYLARWYWRDYLGQPDLTVLNGPLFNASYGGGHGTCDQIYNAAGGHRAAGWVPYGGRGVDVLQFTDCASIPGITRDGLPASRAQTDANAHLGTKAQLHALLLGRTAAPSDTSPAGQEDDMTEQAVKDQIGRIETTLGCFIQGMTETLDQPGLEPGRHFTIAPNVHMNRVLAALGIGDGAAPAPVSPDLAPLITAIREEGTQNRAALETVRAALAAVQSDNADLRRRVAAALGGT